jgi:hypothetical protein
LGAFVVEQAPRLTRLKAKTPAVTPRIQFPRSNGIVIRSKKIPTRRLKDAAPPRAEALYNNAATSAKQESRDLVATGGAGFVH